MKPPCFHYYSYFSGDNHDVDVYVFIVVLFGHNHWPNLRSIFDYPEEIRRAIYTTNAIESLNSVIRHATKKRKIFSSDDSAKKVIYLAVESASQKWTMPIRNWRSAMNWFMIHFDNRITDYL